MQIFTIHVNVNHKYIIIKILKNIEGNENIFIGIIKLFILKLKFIDLNISKISSFENKFILIFIKIIIIIKKVFRNFIKIILLIENFLFIDNLVKYRIKIIIPPIIIKKINIG